MIVVIQCASRKHQDAGRLHRGDGQKVVFVAQPDLAQPKPGVCHAHPDDTSDTGRTWREELVAYNSRHQAEPGYNPHNLLPAWQFYTPPAYGQLAEAFGLDHLFILSAGWGLLPAEFLTPYYDITFSKTVRGENQHERRRKKDDYRDFLLPPIKAEEPIVFLGGKDYAHLFSAVTAGATGPRCLFHKSKEPPDAPGCQFRRYETTARTNWHYECAKALAEGKIRL